jgi:hypothetical protein
MSLSDTTTAPNVVGTYLAAVHKTDRTRSPTRTPPPHVRFSTSPLFGYSIETCKNHVGACELNPQALISNTPGKL